MRRFVSILLLLCTGCMLSPGVRISDSTSIIDVEREHYGEYGRAWIEENHLVLEVVQMPGHSLAQLFVSSHGGDIYISGMYISSGGGRLEKLREFIPSEFRQPGWSERIYWVHGASHYTPFHPWAYEVVRSRILISPGPSHPALHERSGYH